MDLSDSRRAATRCGVRGGEPRSIGPPPLTRIALPACYAYYPGGSVQVLASGFLPCSVLPSPLPSRVGIRIATFEACSGFTHVTARWLARPPMATFVTRLQPTRSPEQAACQLLDQTGYYRGGIFLHWQHAPTGRTGQRRGMLRLGSAETLVRLCPPSESMRAAPSVVGNGAREMFPRLKAVPAPFAHPTNPCPLYTHFDGFAQMPRFCMSATCLSITSRL